MAESLMVAVSAVITIIVSAAAMAAAGSFRTDVDITWGDGRAKILGGGEVLTLSLDRNSGSGFQSKNHFLFGRFDIQMKLVPNNSAGTVTTFYLSSSGPAHDEIDFEFLGNLSGQPYILHTNLYSQGKGDREQQFYLWFDPTLDFHTYSALWSPQEVIWYVDGTPIRVFKNEEQFGVAFPDSQAMRVYASIWDGEDWATRGGLVKTDWSQAPFTAAYKAFTASAVGGCGSGDSSSAARACSQALDLDAADRGRLEWVRKNYMIYDYCADTSRFPGGMPPECAAAQ